MTEQNSKPKINVEIDVNSPGAFIVGSGSNLSSAFREMVVLHGLRVDNFNNFNYLFQFDNFAHNRQSQIFFNFACKRKRINKKSREDGFRLY